ncbi:MAG: protein kinase, partial [Candidatus Aminicenantes bacterium]|nr:protein kinase [Candidatus Aminicenantes bacterium]
MKCPKCDTVNPDDSKFCKDCGTNIDFTREPQPAFTKTVETPIAELRRGTVFADRYEIIEELGRGGMGKVYRVEDQKIKQEIALKLIKPEIASDKKTLERFHNELKTARMISQRNVCRMFDLGESSGTHFITMEYVRGEDLKSMIRMSGQLSIGTATKIAMQICEGLSEAHRLGVVHRDLKPNNIMIDKEGNARIMDFGIARSLSAKGITGAGVMIGTPEYMSPEQVEGKDVDQHSDIYSLGIILYEMLTGRVPFEGDTPFSIGVKQKSETPEPPQKYNPRIPDDLNRLILKCLEKEKEDRPQSAGEVRSEISRIEEGIPTTARPVSDKKTLTSKQITVTFTTKKILIPALVFVAIVVVGLLLWRTLRSPDIIIPPEERLTVAVVSFENHTGDETYAHLQKVIPNLLITNLEQSGYFNVTTWERLKDLLKQIDRGDVEFIDADLGFELCRMEGVEAIVIGSYAKAGEMFATDVKVLDVASKKLLKSTSARGEGEGSILKTQIDELSREISIGVGIPQNKIETAPLRIEDFTTNSIEAYKFFIEGREALYNFYYTESLHFFEKAVEIDPNFGVAYFYLSYINGVLGNIRARNEAIKKGKELVARGVTEKERLWIDMLYARYIDRDIEKSARILQEMAIKFPKEKIIFNVL